MRAKDLTTPLPFEEERMTVQSLGGDGVVVVRSLTFGEKIQMSVAPVEERPALLLAYTVRDEDGRPLMAREQWDRWGLDNDMDFVALTETAKRVSSLDVSAAKKD